MAYVGMCIGQIGGDEDGPRVKAGSNFAELVFYPKGCG